MYTLEEIDSVIEKGLGTLNFNMAPSQLYRPIEYMISIGGKRLRPRLCLLTYNLFSDKIDRSILYPALALEIFHGFTLIHDDIMDNAELRRGQPTVYKKWNSNIAILSGDVMSIKSYELMADCPSAVLPQVLALFTKTAAQVCEGQQYDMNYEALPFITMEDYIKMIGLKTAVLLACSSKIGALIAGTDEKTGNALYDFGFDLGIAFQIQDDYLDTFGQSNVFGKMIGGDILNNKKTWLLVQCFKVAQGKDAEELNYLLSLNDGNADKKIKSMQALYERLGIREMAEQMIRDYHRRAMERIGVLNFSPAQYGQIEAFARRLLNRNK